jgi:hypothetical protein
MNSVHWHTTGRAHDSRCPDVGPGRSIRRVRRDAALRDRQRRGPPDFRRQGIARDPDAGPGRASEPALAEGACRAAHVCAAGGALRSRRDEPWQESFRGNYRRPAPGPPGHQRSELNRIASGVCRSAALRLF